MPRPLFSLVVIVKKVLSGIHLSVLEDWLLVRPHAVVFSVRANSAAHVGVRGGKVLALLQRVVLA